MDAFQFEDYGEYVQDLAKQILVNRGVNAEAMLDYCEKLIERGKKTNDNKLLGFGYYFRAENNYVLNRTEDFLRNIMTALAYLDASGQWELLTRAYNLMAITSLNRGNAPFAMDYYLTSLKYCQNYGLYEMGTIININIGMLYMNCGDYQQAARFFEAGLTLLQKYPEYPGSNDLVFSANIGLANTCLMRHDLMAGRSYMDRAKKAVNLEEGPVNLLIFHCFEARIYQEEKKFTLRDDAIEKISGMMNMEFPLMDIFEDIFRYCELLLETEKYNELWVLLNKLETFTKQSGIHNLEKRILGLKIKYYKVVGENAGYLQAAGLYYEISEMMEKENTYIIGKMLNIRSFLEESTRRQQEMREENEKLQHQSQTDALTGLANRFRLNQEAKKRFEEALTKQIAFGVEILDIDYFKQFNDNYGHQQGDACIQAVANQIRSLEEHPGVFAARYGGDEFVLIYTGYEKDEVEALMVELRDKIKGMGMEHRYSKAASVVTISQGACQGIPLKGDTASDFLHLADEMLYQIKKVSRDSLKVCAYDPKQAKSLKGSSDVDLS